MFAYYIKVRMTCQMNELLTAARFILNPNRLILFSFTKKRDWWS